VHGHQQQRKEHEEASVSLEVDEAEDEDKVEADVGGIVTAAEVGREQREVFARVPQTSGSSEVVEAQRTAGMVELGVGMVEADVEDSKVVEASHRAWAHSPASDLQS
jgi:hypothetical protein